MLQNGWDPESDFLQNDPINRPHMGLEASHFIGEISTRMFMLLMSTNSTYFTIFSRRREHQNTCPHQIMPLEEVSPATGSL
jgi:hypothetical protein